MACESLSWKPSHKTHGLRQLKRPTKCELCHVNFGIHASHKTHGLRQLKRPTKCELCHVNFGIHAMHPLYDIEGPEGRQVVENLNGIKNLAWVHTLCANYIGSYCQTRGCVYLCDENGNYGDDFYDTSKKSFSQDENETCVSDNSEKVAGQKKSEGKRKKTAQRDDQDRKKDGQFSTGHHYVISREDPWKKRISDFRALKCLYCGKRDKTKIPVQCVCCEETELEEFRSRHKESSECYLAMHVGCARWIGNPRSKVVRGDDREDPKREHVYFYPGAPSNVALEEDKFCRPVSLCYCPAHAADITKNQPKIRKKRASSPLSLAKSSKVLRQDKSSECVSITDSSISEKGQDNAKIDWNSIIRDDLVNTISRAKSGGGNILDITDERKAFWKEKTLLGKDEFKTLWKSLKEVVHVDLNNTKNVTDKRKDVSESSQMKRILHLKNEGKVFFTSKNYAAAAEKYQETADYCRYCLQQCSSNSGGNSSTQKHLTKTYDNILPPPCALTTPFKMQSKLLRVTCLSNAATCHFKNGQYIRAVIACNDALAKDNENEGSIVNGSTAPAQASNSQDSNTIIKLLYRRGMSHFLLLKLHEAKVDLMTAHALDRDNIVVKKGLKGVRDQIKEEEERKVKGLCRGFFNGTKKVTSATDSCLDVSKTTNKLDQKQTSDVGKMPKITSKQILSPPQLLKNISFKNEEVVKKVIQLIKKEDNEIQTKAIKFRSKTSSISIKPEGIKSEHTAPMTQPHAFVDSIFAVDDREADSDICSFVKLEADHSCDWV
eukprot:CAMPEP_0194393774 /NCGR_PEP_ID=MMETSP0174-20130528/123483_1 /TAXON_ID=216777 /ORGANISM="Proboscia alata, Strain PI-D3" /LENGTH=774 /DNA_ID=CAMNT_0039189493 /DNA_START=435 /DNA_END=2759 /DNA_ORIENTATION=-